MSKIQFAVNVANGDTIDVVTSIHNLVDGCMPFSF